MVLKMSGPRDDACVDSTEVNKDVKEAEGAPGIESVPLAIAKGGCKASICTAGADGLCRTPCGTPLGKVVIDFEGEEVKVPN